MEGPPPTHTPPTLRGEGMGKGGCAERGAEPPLRPNPAPAQRALAMVLKAAVGPGRGAFPNPPAIPPRVSVCPPHPPSPSLPRHPTGVQPLGSALAGQGESLLVRTPGRCVSPRICWTGCGSACAFRWATLPGSAVKGEASLALGVSRHTLQLSKRVGLGGFWRHRDLFLCA